MITEIPYVFVQTTYYTLIVYAMVRFEWEPIKFLWFFFVNFFSFLYFTYFGMMNVSATPNLHLAAVVSNAFYSVFNLFSGFYIPGPVSTTSFKTSTNSITGLKRNFFFGFCIEMAEHSNMVDLVLLDLSDGVDCVRPDRVSVWGHGGRY